MQLASLSAYNYNVHQAETKEKRNIALKDQNDFSTGQTVFNVDIKALTGSSSQGTFSGSLDVREIRKLFSRIGLNLDGLKCDEMVIIRNCRNKLAHGEESFQECCRNYSIQYLEVNKNNTLDYLDQLIIKVGDYIQTKSYMKPKEDIHKGNFIARIISAAYIYLCSHFR